MVLYKCGRHLTNTIVYLHKKRRRKEEGSVPDSELLKGLRTFLPVWNSFLLQIATTQSCLNFPLILKCHLWSEKVPITTSRASTSDCLEATSLLRPGWERNPISQLLGQRAGAVHLGLVGCKVGHHRACSRLCVHIPGTVSRERTQNFMTFSKWFDDRQKIRNYC